MKRLSYFPIYLLGILLLISCSEKPRDQEPPLPVPPLKISTFDLEGDQSSAWWKLEDEWHKDEMNVFLEKYEIEMNCMDCESVNLHGTLFINAEGKLTRYEVKEKHFCKDPEPAEMEEDFMRFFEEIIYPEELRNTELEIILGDALAC